MVDIQSTAAEIRRGKKDRRKKKPQGKNIMVCPITYRATIMSLNTCVHSKLNMDLRDIKMCLTRAERNSLSFHCTVFPQRSPRHASDDDVIKRSMTQSCNAAAGLDFFLLVPEPESGIPNFHMFLTLQLQHVQMPPLFSCFRQIQLAFQLQGCSSKICVTELERLRRRISRHNNAI